MKKGVYLLSINQKGLLLVKKKNRWILAGGKIENGESDYKCLYRELKEKLGISKKLIKIGKYYSSFIGKIPNSKTNLEAKVYFGDLNGILEPQNEIKETRFVKNVKDYNLSEITSKIINSLYIDGILK